MKLTLVPSLFLALGLLVSSVQAQAASAELLLSPTRIVLENGEKFASVVVRNNGDSGGRYKIEIVDTAMAENGALSVLPDGQKDPFSAQGLISYSPHSLTLKADENQPVRILIKNYNELPDGEYRSHLKVKMTENDLDAVTGQKTEQGAVIRLKPKMTTIIPIIIRKGTTNYAVTMDDARLGTDSGAGTPVPQVTVTLGFSGNRSVLGDLKVVHTAADGKETELALFRGLAIYRGVARRVQTVPLNVPDGLNIHTGKILVSFIAQDKQENNVLATKEITP